MNEITNHAGLEIPEESDFFAEAPKELGQLLSGYTSLKTNDEPSGWSKRMVVAAAGTGAGLLVGLGITHVAELSPQGFPYYIWVIGMPALGLLAGMGTTAFQHTCTYVGEGGLARHTLKKSRKGRLETEALRFSDVDALHVTLTDEYNGMFYEKTTYAYEWKDQRGATRFKIEGSYCEKSGPPKDLHHPYYFAPAAEDAWNDYKLDRMVATLENGGNVFFRADGVNLELGLGTLNVYEGERRLKWDVAHIDSVSLRDGGIFIYSDRYREAGAVSQLMGKGSLRIPYGSMANAGLFMLLLKLLLGKSEAV